MSEMQLTKEQQAILDGAQGDVLAKVMQTLVLYGQVFGSEKMVPVTGQYGHLVTSFGLSVLDPVYALMDRLIESNTLSKQKFSVDPRPLDPGVPSNFLKNIIFKKMYGKQNDYEAQLKTLGILNEDAFTCTCYMDEVGNSPKEGEILSWAESSAVVYANSVLGARCNRNSGILELFGSICGYVPYFGLLTDEGRKASWQVQIQTSSVPEAQLLGSAIGMKVMEEVPYIRGLDVFLGDALTPKVKAYLKDMGAATASNGAVGLFHVENLTPEAKTQGPALIQENAPIYVIDDAELARVQKNYPCIWKNENQKPKVCFIGCPHLSLFQLEEWAQRIEEGLLAANQSKVQIPTVMTAAPSVLKAFKDSPAFSSLQKRGVILSYICPLMYMNNPLCAKTPTITCSNKLRTYTSSRYYTEPEILEKITRGFQA